MSEYIKVLIVEDQVVIRERLVSMLSGSHGIQVVGVTGRLAQARRLIAEHAPHVVTLDLHLEDGNGIDLLQTLKRTRGGASDAPAPNVIVLTNYSGTPFRRKCEQCGADYFLDKATEFEKVRSIVLELAGTGGRQTASSG